MIMRKSASPISGVSGDRSIVGPVHRFVADGLSLPDFEGEEERSNEALLEGIQMAWLRNFGIISKPTVHFRLQYNAPHTAGRYSFGRGWNGLHSAPATANDDPPLGQLILENFRVDGFFPEEPPTHSDLAGAAITAMMVPETTYSASSKSKPVRRS